MPVAVPVAVRVGVPVAVPVGVPVAMPVGVRVAVRVAVRVGVPVGDEEREAVALGGTDGVPVPEVVRVGVADVVAALLGVCDAVLVPDGVAAAEGSTAEIRRTRWLLMSATQTSAVIVTGSYTAASPRGV